MPNISEPAQIKAITETTTISNNMTNRANRKLLAARAILLEILLIGLRNNSDHMGEWIGGKEIYLRYYSLTV